MIGTGTTGAGGGGGDGDGGAPNTASNVTAPLGTEGVDAPTSLTAVSWNVYGVPSVKPTRSHSNAGAVLMSTSQMFPPGEAVTL